LEPGSIYDRANVPDASDHLSAVRDLDVKVQTISSPAYQAGRGRELRPHATRQEVLDEGTHPDGDLACLKACGNGVVASDFGQTKHERRRGGGWKVWAKHRSGVIFGDDASEGG
jgi:hypothetical protein